MNKILCAIVVAACAALSCLDGVQAQESPGVKASPSEPPRIDENRNLSPAGTLRDGVLTLDLEIREGQWYPEAETGRIFVVQAFGEKGRSLQVPGPLVRVPEGTEVRASLRNTLAKGTARVYGLHARPRFAGEPLDVAPGETREVRFNLATAGTYHYWATTTGAPMTRRANLDSQLSGAIVVDPPGVVANDRIFVIGTWIERRVPANSDRKPQQLSVVNGKSWPYTERFTHVAGEQIRWRWINTSFMEHPMHFHGAYFLVTSEGDGAVDVALPAEKHRLVATAFMSTGGTNAFTLLPEREGRWLFHCHLLVHMSAEYRYLSSTPAGFQPALEPHHGDADSHGMSGIVLGITILPGAKAAPATVSSEAPRKLTLLVREKPATARLPGATVFQLQEGSVTPAIEAGAVPGPSIVLTQGNPVEITVVNQLREPTAIHWHGIELDSYYDGVPGWGGLEDRTTPQVDPGESFTARFTPPRAGTFIYHTHWHNFLQLTGGLYGPLIVLPPGQKLDPETDKTIVISLGGSDDINSPLLLNGHAQPDPLRLKAGAKSRLRFINITPNNGALEVALRSGSAPVRWRAVAKDGVDLPPAQRVEQEATQLVSVGETYDFEFESATKQDLRLEVLRPFNRTLSVAEVQVR